MEYSFQKTESFNYCSTVYNVYKYNKFITQIVIGYNIELEKYYYCEVGTFFSDSDEHRRCSSSFEYLKVLKCFIDNVFFLLDNEEIVQENYRYKNNFPLKIIENLLIYGAELDIIFTVPENEMKCLTHEKKIDDLIKNKIFNLYGCLIMTYDDEGDEIEEWKYTDEVEYDTGCEESYFTIDYEKINQYLEIEASASPNI